MRDRSGSDGPWKEMVAYLRVFSLLILPAWPCLRWEGTDGGSPLPFLEVHTEKSDWIYSELTKTVLHWALSFAKEPKEREYTCLPTHDKRTPRRSSGSQGLKDNAGGVSISHFSSEPRGGQIAGARWWWGALAARPRQNCSVSWAGARCKEGCCSSWCTLSSVSQGSRRIGTQRRRWGRLRRTHRTCGTWSLQHNPRGVVNCCWPKDGSSLLLPQPRYLVGPARYFQLFHWAPPPPPPKYKWEWWLLPHKAPVTFDTLFQKLLRMP